MAQRAAIILAAGQGTRMKSALPKVMHEVNHKTLDVTSIVILIGHDHQVTVTQRLDVRLVIRSAKL